LIVSKILHIIRSPRLNFSPTNQHLCLMRYESLFSGLFQEAGENSGVKNIMLR
jgi:hypothetical protein